MNCSDAEQLYDAYLDGELSGALRLEFDAHRLCCSTCQKKIAMLESFEFVVASDKRGPALSDDFTERVMAEVADAPIRLRTRRRRTIAAAIVLQAAAAALFIMLWPWPGASRDDPAVVRADADRSERLEIALKDPTGEDLKRYMFSELMRSLHNTLEHGVGGLPNYAWNLNLPESLFDDPHASPFNSVLRSLLPAAPEQSEPPRPASAERIPL